jgi:16S rRNA processing protein RimM
VVAEIVRPRGNRGEVWAISQTDVPGRLETLRRARVRLADGSDIEMEIAQARVRNGRCILKFAGVDSIDAAEKFRGAELWVPAAERAALAAGEFFETDLLGCVIVDAATGKDLGRLTGWQRYGGPPLMEVSGEGREMLVPFVQAICRRVDLEARRIEVDLPEGFLEL